MVFWIMSIVFNVISVCVGKYVFDKVGWIFDISMGKQFLFIVLINCYFFFLCKVGVCMNGNFLQLNKDVVVLVMFNLKFEIKMVCLDYFE